MVPGQRREVETALAPARSAEIPIFVGRILNDLSGMRRKRTHFVCDVPSIRTGTLVNRGRVVRIIGAHEEVILSVSRHDKGRFRRASVSSDFRMREDNLFIAPINEIITRDRRELNKKIYNAGRDYGDRRIP